eukprot:CAMPEP_0115427618 /NCGR_PEP_ID=MMETSP0271-20121206/29546_1 /TAXON_ID=71861 /ORGANISM="Scrippsiella trochoidea, Strain CCMP3099" /LENGTH=449 /DNA_ID=CAMNT_0002852669 /DNA_START=57 /DNA_END=1407 /DNA_ORIENTATION=+
MPVNRPEPLSVEFEETASFVAPLTAPAGATLLGRTRHATPIMGVKKPLAVTTPLGHAPVPPTPGAINRLTPLARISPLGSVRSGSSPLQQALGFTPPFTPMMTPSPTGGQGLFHRDLKMSIAAAAAGCLPAPSATSAVPCASVGQDAEKGRSGSIIHGTRLITEAPTSLTAIRLAEEEEDDENDDDDNNESGDDINQPQALRRPEDAPKPPKGAVHPSLGSAGHASGACKRCCFFSRGKCANGYECMFCHYEHDKRKRRTKRAGRKKAVAALLAAQGNGARPRSVHTLVGMTKPGCMPKEGPAALAMPNGYSMAQVVQVMPQQGHLLYSSTQVVPMALQQGALAPSQLTSGTCSVMQPGQMLVTPAGNVAASAPMVCSSSSSSSSSSSCHSASHRAAAGHHVTMTGGLTFAAAVNEPLQLAALASAFGGVIEAEAPIRPEWLGQGLCTG